MEGIFAIAVGLIMCESDAPGRKLDVSSVNRIRGQVKNQCIPEVDLQKFFSEESNSE